jgi:peptide deformylase
VRIVKYPHPTLRHKSKPLARVDKELLNLVRQMFDLLYEHRGVGLAANQVDLPYRLFILNLESDPEQKDKEFVFINPVITQRKGMEEKEEGCLSFPEIYAPIRRPEKVTVAAYNLAGQEVRYEASGLFARAVQHEFDHLDGVLFIDRMSEESQLKFKEKLGLLDREFHDERSRGLIPGDELLATRLAQLEQLRTA